MTIGILGGGLTGLTLGYLLNENKIEFEILEKDNECGGLMRSYQKDGFTFDYGGSHIIFSKDEEVLNFLISILKDNHIKNKRDTKILYNGRYIKYPFENGLAELSKFENFECLNYFIQNLIKKEKGELDQPKNIMEWFGYTFGDGISEKYLLPYNEKIWKYPLDQIGLEWVERVPNPPIDDIIKSSLGIDTDGYSHQLYFYYPRFGGIQAIIETLKEPIDKKIVTNFEVEKIVKKKGHFEVSNKKETRIYDQIISTIPIHDLINSLNVPEYVNSAVRNLHYNSLITVMIGIEKSKINDFSWLYIPDKKVLTHRISFPSNYSPQVCPINTSSILAEITCNVGDNIWKMTDQEILDKTVEDLENLKIIDRKNICFNHVKRMKYAYVISDLSCNDNMKIINQYLEHFGIDLVGRFAEFKYMNMDACVRNSMDFVKNKW